MSGTSSGGKTDASCLVDASSNTRSLLSLQMCGNGIVEDGEDCAHLFPVPKFKCSDQSSGDPGNGVTSSCCDSSTCKFTSGSQCDPSSSACCTSQVCYRSLTGL